MVRVWLIVSVGRLIDLPQVVQIIRPLLTVLELEGQDRIVTVLTFGLSCDTQAFGSFRKISVSVSAIFVSRSKGMLA